MIVPQTRLIVWSGVATVGLGMLVASGSAAAVTATVVVVSFALAVAVDAAWAFGRLDGIRATLPEIVRMSKDRESQVEIEVETEVPGARRIRLGVVFPAGIESPCDDVIARLPADALRFRVEWPCTPRRRGCFAVENVYMETSSPLGLWAIRGVSPTRTEVRVYPNLQREQKNMAALFLNRGMLGVHVHRQVGKGREFEKLREYIPGDSSEDIHWKATAKRGRPITKVFQIERTQEVYVVMDASRLSSRAVSMSFLPEAGQPANVETTQLERFITAALVLGLVAERQGDMFGFLAFSDHVDRFVRARNGKAHYGACRDALYTLEPKRVNPDFGELCSFIRLRLRRRALLIVLTNLDDPVLAESFVQNIDVLAQHHLVLVNMLAVHGVAPLFSDPEVTLVDDLYRCLGGHIQWHELRQLGKVLQRHGVSMNLVDNEKICPHLVSQYLGVKQRQLL